MARLFRYSIVVMSFAVFLIGTIYSSFNTILVGVLLMLTANIIYSFENINRRLLFFVFNAVVFIFLISRPTISMLRGNLWWYFNYNSVYFALDSLFITLVFLQIGAYLSEQYIYRKATISDMKKDEIIEDKKKQEFYNCLQIVSLILFYISILFTFLQEGEKLIFMRGREYEQFYTDFHTSLPFVVSKLAELSKYFLCIFLATMPSKKRTVVPLLLYVFSAVPMLLIGARNPIVLNILFAVIYFFIREIYKDKDKWIGKFEKLCLCVGTPIAIVLLGALNYIRAGQSAATKGIFSLMVDFIYKQGVSFDVLCIGYRAIPKILYTGFVNYTFGPIIDYFAHGTIAQKLFGAIDLGSGNNIVMALYSNSFAHRMSYISRGEDYLNGNGWGSSYILETYADFGYIGIVIFSLIMGMLLIGFIPWIKKNWFCGYIILLFLTDIFFTPRDAALAWVSNIFTVQFILATIFCLILSKLMIKTYTYGNMIKEDEKYHDLIKEGMKSNV